MDYALSTGGLLVHDRSDWPCAVCRPGRIMESRGYCLCANCARNIIAAAAAGFTEARALVSEISDALLMLEGVAPEVSQLAN